MAKTKRCRQCGNTFRGDPIYSGVVGVFCTVGCRDNYLETSSRPPFTLSDLMLAIAQMPEELRSLPVRWWGDERGGLVKRARILTEDHVNIDNIAYPLSEAREVIAADEPGWTPEQIDAELAGLHVCAKAGQLILEVDD